MALYSEKALLNMIHKKKELALKPERYSGLYYEDPKSGTKKYIVIGKQMGGQVYTTNPYRQERRLKLKKSWHPEAKKVEAATLHVAIGNMERVSELTKVPVGTLRKWKDEDWWLTTQQRVKRESMEETDSKFSKLIDKAIDKLNKAVEEGDYMYDYKRGELVKVPMTGRDLSIVAGTVFDKRQLLRGEATRITKTSDPEKHLAELARRFAEMVTMDKTNEKVIEGEVLNYEGQVQRPGISTERGTERYEPIHDGQLPDGTVQEAQDDGDAGSPEEAAYAADADDALPAKT